MSETTRKLVLCLINSLVYCSDLEHISRPRCLVATSFCEPSVHAGYNINTDISLMGCIFRYILYNNV